MLASANKRIDFGSRKSLRFFLLVKADGRLCMRASGVIQITREPLRNSLAPRITQMIPKVSVNKLRSPGGYVDEESEAAVGLAVYRYSSNTGSFS